jgi:hypothetical protein
MSLRKNGPKCGPTHVFVEIITNTTLNTEIVLRILVHVFHFPKTAQNEQSPSRLKFAQSGRPTLELESNFFARN